MCIRNKLYICTNMHMYIIIDTHIHIEVISNRNIPVYASLIKSQHNLPHYVLQKQTDDYKGLRDAN